MEIQQLFRRKSFRKTNVLVGTLTWTALDGSRGLGEKKKKILRLEFVGHKLDLDLDLNPTEGVQR